MAEQKKRKKCQFCGARITGIRKDMADCGTFGIGRGHITRGDECYERELKQVKAQRDKLRERAEKTEEQRDRYIKASQGILDMFQRLKDEGNDWFGCPSVKKLAGLLAEVEREMSEVQR